MRQAEWVARAEALIDQWIADGVDFSANDLHRELGQPDPTHEPNGRNNAVGTVFSRPARDGRIVVVNHTTSIVPTRKSGLIRVWRRAS